ncbi:MAG TPA: SRPBCC family protein [Pseudonocardiaceae bacterium]
MGDFRHVAPVDMPADELFDFLAKPDNLPRYFPAMTEAEPVGGDRVHVEADLGNRHVEAEAWLQVDRRNRHLSWGAPGEDDYHGELTIVEQGPNRCEVSVTLHTERAGGDEVQRGLEQTLASLAQRAVRDADMAEGEGRAGQ